ncbi:MAG: hypothetical protein NUV84_02270 [Candidatus Uhrbacteria bacterium]|nr:hypothetical protein [Candidatus Uhrbacteria bacterium]
MSQEITRILAQLTDHERRIALLEGAATSMAPKKSASPAKTDYFGATGGVRYLISQGFFKEKRDLSTVREQLGKEDYHYSRQAAHEALKTLSKPACPLVNLKEGKRKTYVERK